MKDEVIENNQSYVYTTDVFLKYKDLNKKAHPNFEKYYNENINKIRKTNGSDILEKQDIRVKLNYIITKKNISNEDENLYSIIRYNLNKVNNKMLIEGVDNGLQATINTLTGLPYTNINHFQKLTEMLVDKTINEPKFCSIYARLCSELAPYYIQNGEKKIYFRHILLNTCQTTFETFLNNCEKIEREKLSGLMNFIGELYNRKLLTNAIIQACFDRLSNLLEKSINSAEGISSLVVSCYSTLLQNPEQLKYFNEKLNKYADNGKLHIRSKFALQNALEKLQGL